MLELNKIHQGDCIELMKQIDSDSIDAIVSDPPYGLEFMGKDWDAHESPKHFEEWTTKWATEALRILKSGGFLFSMGGTRTYHRMTCGLEDAGFTIKDCIMWLYGSGFPKAQDISKLIDKKNGRTQETYVPFAEYLKQKRQEKQLSMSEIDKQLGLNTAYSWWEGRLSGIQLPMKKYYLKLKDILGLDSRFDELIEREEAEREIIGKEKYTAPIELYKVGENKEGTRTELLVSNPSTDLAKQWSGWKTPALKPAYEPVVIAQKPCEGSITENVMKHGVGGFNVDECRIALDGDKKIKGGCRTRIDNESHLSFRAGQINKEDNSKGRFPANIILDEEAGRMLDSQWEGASRFYYVPKASKSERNAGLDNFINIEVYNILCEETRIDKSLTKEEVLVKLLVDMGQFPPKVIGVSGTQNKQDTEWSTMLFGNKLMEKYQEGAISIIGTKTSSTIQSRTLNWLMLLFTKEYTQDVKLLTDNGGSPVRSVEQYTELTISISERMASLLGVNYVASGTQLRIKLKDGRQGHPTVKPIRLFEYLIKLCTTKDSIVLDPFLGSGTTAIACVNLGRRWIGIEKDAEYCKIAEARIKEYQNQSKLEIESKKED